MYATSVLYDVREDGSKAQQPYKYPSVPESVARRPITEGGRVQSAGSLGGAAGPLKLE